MKQFEYKGEWWIPSRPKERVAGYIRFSTADGATLDLIGSFDISHDFLDIILGLSYVNGIGKITLYKCYSKGSHVSIPGAVTSSYNIGTVFLGEHFNKDEDSKFAKLFVHYSYFDEWTNISGFKLDFKEILKKEKKWTIRYELPDSFEAKINEDLEISLIIQAIPPELSEVQKEASIKQRTWIGINTLKEKHWSECIETIYYIES
jgi:hypothetical protein